MFILLSLSNLLVSGGRALKRGLFEQLDFKNGTLVQTLDFERFWIILEQNS